MVTMAGLPNNETQDRLGEGSSLLQHSDSGGRAVQNSPVRRSPLKAFGGSIHPMSTTSEILERESHQVHG